MFIRQAHKLVILLLAAILTVVIVGCGAKKSSNTILIGEYSSLTGSTADFGKETHNGIQLAIDEVNSEGGILGKKIELKTEDDRSDPAEAKTAITKLITRDRVTAVIGEIASTRTLNAAPVAQTNKVPMITPASTNEKVTQVGDYIFRVCFLDAFQGEVCAKFADMKKFKRAAIIKDVRNDYSIGLAESFTNTFMSLGGTVVANESYSEGDTDFSSQLTVIKSKKPDVLFIPGYYAEVSLIAIKARQLGLSIPMLGGDGWDSSSLIPNAGKALEGCWFSNHYSSDNPDENVQNFVKAYKSKYGHEPNALSALGYDTAMMLIDAIKRAGSTDGAKIRDALANTNNFPGVAGSISIDSNRNARKPAVILEVEGKKFKHVQTINP